MSTVERKRRACNVHNLIFSYKTWYYFYNGKNYFCSTFPVTAYALLSNTGIWLARVKLVAFFAQHSGVLAKASWPRTQVWMTICEAMPIHISICISCIYIDPSLASADTLPRRRRVLLWKAASGVNPCKLKSFAYISLLLGTKKRRSPCLLLYAYNKRSTFCTIFPQRSLQHCFNFISLFLGLRSPPSLVVSAAPVRVRADEEPSRFMTRIRWKLTISPTDRGGKVVRRIQTIISHTYSHLRSEAAQRGALSAESARRVLNER